MDEVFQMSSLASIYGELVPTEPITCQKVFSHHGEPRESEDAHQHCAHALGIHLKGYGRLEEETLTIKEQR